MDEHIPKVTRIEIEQAGWWKTKYRVMAYGGNNQKLLWSQPYKEKRQAEGLRVTMLCMIVPDRLPKNG